LLQGVCIVIQTWHVKQTLKICSLGFYLKSKSGSCPLYEASTSPLPPATIKYISAKCRCQTCTTRIDVTTTSIVSNNFALHGIHKKQWSKWNIVAQNIKSVTYNNLNTQTITYHAVLLCNSQFDFPLFFIGRRQSPLGVSRWGLVLVGGPGPWPLINLTPAANIARACVPETVDYPVKGIG